MSTAPRDLAAIRHALELGLILAALIIATIMIVTAAHDDSRKLTPDITIGPSDVYSGLSDVDLECPVQPPYMYLSRFE
jgi:hypothetical protein